MGDTLPIPAVSAFEGFEQSVFTVTGDDGPAVLELAEIDTSADTVDGWQRFSLVFEGPADERLEQGLFRLEHPELGEFETVLVPVWTRGSSPDRAQYQAVVDREVPHRRARSRGSRGPLGRAIDAIGGVLGGAFGPRPVASVSMSGTDSMGSIGLFAGNFAPRGYASCDGQLMPIAQYSALFSILGTTYGGDGRTTFALPDLRGRVPLHVGSGQGPGMSRHRLDETGGSETVTLTGTQVPMEGYSLPVSSAEGDAATPVGNVLAAQGSPGGSPPAPVYSTGNADASMSIQGSGGNAPHDNMPPYLGLNYVIALQGMYPTRN